MKVVHSLRVALATLLLMLIGGTVQADEPVAMVTDLRGNAWLLKGEREERLNILSYLDQGGRIRLDNKSSISITTFSPAAEYSVSGPAKLELIGGEVHVLNGGKPVKLTLDAQKANAGRQFSAVQKERLAMAAMRMRGSGGDGFGLKQISPVNVEILNVRPVFTWSAPLEAKKCILTLVDETEGKTVKKVTVNEQIWQMPSDLLLLYQHQYSWEVRASLISGQEIVSLAAFSMIDEARAKRILQSKPPADGPFSERVLYAVLLESEGLNNDAVEEWKSLAAERPNEQLIAIHFRNH